MITTLTNNPQKIKLKTREEIIGEFENELIVLEAMILNIDGYDKPLSFNRSMEDLPQELYFRIPEYCTYTLTIQYRVKKRTLKNLSYHHIVKKHGIPLNIRDHKMHESAPVNSDAEPTHSITFAPESVPGGPILRGVYPAKSKILEDGKTIMRCHWTIELIKEGEAPGVGCV